MDFASLAVLHAAASALELVGATDSDEYERAQAGLRAAEWEDRRQQTRVARESWSRARSVGAPQPTATKSAMCVACRRFFAGAGEDCYAFEAPHAPGITTLVCAKCVYREMRDAAPTTSLSREIAAVYCLPAPSSQIKS